MAQEDKRRRFWKRIITAVIIVFVVVPLLAVTGIAVFRYQHQKPSLPQTVVPNLKGLDLNTAETQARQTQLSPQVMLRRWDIPAPVGTIVGQVPAAGMTVPVGTTIGLELCVEDPNKAVSEKKKDKQP